MKQKIKRSLAALLAFIVLATSFTPPVAAEAASVLVNVAKNGNAVTDHGNVDDDHKIENIIDGDDSTSWQTNVWPATAVVQLDYGRMISKVVVKLGDGAAGGSANVTVQYAQNGVTSDLINVGSQRVNVNSDGTFTASTPFSATHIYVTLAEPQNGTFNPAIEEIEVYEAQEVQLSKYNNIAKAATITATGNNEHGTEGSANLVDGNDTTLYKFYNAAMTSEQTITLAYDQARSMDAFRIAFENVGASDGNAFSFVYSILAKNSDGSYDTIVANATANRTNNSSQTYQIAEKTYSEVQIVMHSCKAGSNNGWPAIAEFEVYGNEIKVDDSESIANGKPVHVSSGKSTASNITDGSKNSTWRGSYYPAYVDIDLEANYNINTVEVYTPENGYSQYSIYTSLDGRNFTKFAEKTSRDSASLTTGEVYQAQETTEARIVRVYMEYNSAEVAAVINEVRVTGTATGTPVQSRPAIAVQKFDESSYKDTLTVTAQDTYDEVYGIIGRRLGENYKNWFSLELASNPNGSDYDYYELSMVNGKVHVKGNDGVSLATGINYYLKNYCKVNISQVGDQVNMPAQMPTVTGTIHKETKAKVRYSYNYCTLSYSMAFWGEKEWRDELDWLAMNGVNVVLDATAQEEVWRRFLGRIGYTHEDIKDYIAGPAYYAWAYMANLSGFGGPVHDSWFEERTELARKNQLTMRKLGMQPVLQGYSGMVPTDIQSYDASAQIISQGNWCSFQRPAMLVTTSDTFDKYAKMFYECQLEVYGNTSDYYATDPFHEGGNTGGMNSADISEEVLTSMLEADEDAIWIIQAWQGNPTTALLNGLDDVENGAQHALILDLYAEKTPHYAETGSSYGDTDEFDATPWLFCMLNNFGGRLGLHGHLDNLANNIPAVFNNRNHIAGIGITPEASVNNPVLYEFFFETIWQDDATANMSVINLNEWLAKYAERRYGAASESANEAWAILKETVYKSSLNNLGQGAPESVVNARPALSIKAASTWGNAIVSYDKIELEKAAALLLKDYKTLKDSEGYLYDVATVLQQVLSNSAQEYQKKMASAFNSKDLASFEKYAATFMEIIDAMEQVTSTSEYYLLGRWVEQAKALAANADDFTKKLYEINAKALVTTWGSYNQAESGGLKDYSNRQWSGLINDFYKVRWERWITARTNELNSTSYESNINWFQWEWEWVRGNDAYTTTPTERDLSVLGAEILEKYTVLDEASDDSRDVDTKTMSVTAGTQSSSDVAGNVLDGDPNTIWHSNWSDGNQSKRDNHYLIFTFDKATTIDGMRYLQRNGSINGAILKYELYVSTSDTGDDWTQIVDDGTFENTTSWQFGSFEATEAKRVKLVVTDAMSGESNSNVYASAAEVRFTTSQSEEDNAIGTLVPEGDTVSAYPNIAPDAGIDSDGTEHPKNGKANLIDEQEGTIYQFHNGQLTEEKYVTLSYDDIKKIDGVRIVFEKMDSDSLANYEFVYSILARNREGEYDTIVSHATGNRTDAYAQGYKFDEHEYTEIKIIMHECHSTLSQDNGCGWPAIAEFEIYGTDAEETPENVDKEALQAAITAAGQLSSYNHSSNSWNALQAALAAAKTANENVKATQEEVDEALANLQAALEALEWKDKDVTVRVDDTFSIFDKSGAFDESGLDTLDPTIANVTVETKTVTDKVAKLYNGSTYDGDNIDWRECVYTFKQNDDGTYTISAKTENGTIVYLNPHTQGQDVGYPNSEKPEKITVQKVGDEFSFTDMTDTDHPSLQFIHEWYVFNEAPNNPPKVISTFKLYEIQESIGDDGETVYTYQEVSDVKDGGQYVIMAEYTHANADYKYALRPSADFSDGVGRNTHVAKMTDDTTTITGNEITIEGLSKGDTLVTVGKTNYNITVKDKEIASAIGTSTGLEVKRLTMSANNTFNLDVINTNADIEWKVTDKDGNVVTWASVSEDGVVSAANPSDSVNTYEGYIVATTSDGKELRTELKISPAPTSAETRLFDIYIGELYHTDVYYGWFYEYNDPTAEDGKSYGASSLTQVVEGEVIYISMGSKYTNAIDFFAKPDEGYALGHMGATNAQSHYMKISGSDPAKTDFITSNGVAGNQQYQLDPDVTAALVDQALKLGCEGAQGFTRYDGSIPNDVKSILDYRSEKLPTVKKEVVGVLGSSGLQADWQPVQDGETLTAEVGDYVYFKITVETYDAEDLITYSNVKLKELLADAYFYTKDPNDLTKPINERKTEEDIDISADGLVGNTHEYYVVYQISKNDVVSPNHKVVNNVALDYAYSSTYSESSYGGVAEATAGILITTTLAENLVVDFGLPVTYEFESAKQLVEMTDENTKYGTVTVTSEVNGNNLYTNKITYKPTQILKEADVIAIQEVSTDSEPGMVTYIGVYPATSVYYEEGFMDLADGSWGNSISKGENAKQEVHLLSENYEAIDKYGYDTKYAKEAAGPSNGSEAVSTTARNNASFTFKGTGVDIYANCQSGDDPTGTASIMVKDSAGTIKKLMIVNTKIAGSSDEGAVTAFQNSMGTAYNIPIASVSGLENAEYEVKINHSITKAESESEVVYPLRLDGFRVYNTIEDSSIFEVHREANPNFVEMRNVVLNSLDLNEILATPTVTPEVSVPEKLNLDNMTASVSGTFEISGKNGENPTGVTSADIIDKISDGYNTTFWTSNFKADGIAKGNPYLIIDLGDTYTLTQVDYTPRWADGHNWKCTGSIQNLILEVSKNGSEWTAVTGESGLDLSNLIENGSSSNFPYAIDIDSVNARYIRLSGTESYYWDSANDAKEAITVGELAIYGAEYSEPVESIYANDIATGLTQVLDKSEAAGAVILTPSSDDYTQVNGKDLLDNGPKNEIFLYKGQTLAFKVGAGYRNIQLGLKAVNASTNITLNNGGIEKSMDLTTSTDMFYGLGDVGDAEKTITLTNNGDGVLSITDLKYFEPEQTGTETASVFTRMHEEDFMPILLDMGYEEAPTEENTPTPEATPTPEDSVEHPFTDVKEGEFYYESVLWAVENKIAYGVSTDKFAPMEDCTRAEIVTFLWRAADKPKAENVECTFEDVKEGEYYYDAVLWAVEKGITKGLDEKTFGTNDKCTRAQMVTFLWRAAGKPMAENTECTFSDVVSGEYYYDAMLWAVDHGITYGKTADTFAPNDSVTRGETVTFLYRAFK